MTETTLIDSRRSGKAGPAPCTEQSRYLIGAIASVISGDRYFKDKDTTLPWEILHAYGSTVGVDGLFRNGQAQAETGLAFI